MQSNLSIRELRRESSRGRGFIQEDFPEEASLEVRSSGSAQHLSPELAQEEDHLGREARTAGLGLTT